jgi:hypothetical protein
MTIHNKKELFDFAAMVCLHYQSMKEANLNVMSFVGPVTSYKYSIRFNDAKNQLVRIDFNTRQIEFSPLIAKEFCNEIIVTAIIWGFVRPDLDITKEGNVQADLIAIDIVKKFYTHFDNALYIEQLDRLINSDKSQTERIFANKKHLDSIVTKD